MSRAGWSRGMLSASKLYASVSISGPSATEKPSPVKIRTISSCTRVSGCTTPRAGRRPGSVRSGRSLSRWRRRSVARAASRRDSSSASSSRLASLAAAPTCGRSSAGSAPRDLRICVRPPERPRYRTRIASSSADEAAPSMAARASPATASTRGWLTPPSARLGLGGLGELGERAGVADGELGEHLAVQQHARLLQRGHEARVGQAGLAARRVDAYDPERARRALLLLAVPVREGARAQNRLGRRAVQLAPAADEALRLLEDLLAPSARLRSTLRPWHLPAPPVVLFRGKEPALPAARPHQLARRRALQPLARAALRLHLRHVAVSRLSRSATAPPRRSERMG